MLCLCLAFGVGLLAFSSDNLSNAREGREPVQITQQNTVYAVNAYVYNIRVNGFGAEYVTVEFISSDGVAVREEYPTEIKNDDLYFVLDREVENMRLISAKKSDNTEIDLIASIGTGAEGVCYLEINPTKLNIDWFLTAMLAFFPFVMIYAIFETVKDKSEFKKDVFAIKRYKYLLYDLVMRDIKTKYRRSALGLLWSVLNPLLMMAVLTAVFSQIIRVEVEGGFALFYLTGYLMFNFVSESSNFSLVSMLQAAPLIKKVYIPKYIFPLEKTIFSLVNMVFSLLAFVIVFVVFLIMGRVSLHATMLLFFVPIIYMFIFAFGLNLVLAALNVYFRDVGHIWGVLLTVWMYASPIIYPIDMVPDWLQSVIRINPLYHYITYFRNIMIYGTVPSLSDNIICIAFSVAMLAIGVVAFRKSQSRFVLHI